VMQWMLKKTVVGGLGELANVMMITSQSSFQVRSLLNKHGAENHF